MHDTTTRRVRALRRGHDGAQVRERGAVFDLPEGIDPTGCTWFEFVPADTPLELGTPPQPGDWEPRL